MIGIVGGGAFGSALAVVLARGGGAVTLWARSGNPAKPGPRPQGIVLPATVTVTSDLEYLAGAEVVLLAVPTQALAGVLERNRRILDGRSLVGCCKGIDLSTGRGPVAIIEAACPAAPPALLTGPSFAADIARGLPTALTLACADDSLGQQLQARLSAKNLRLYRTTDIIGAELGGALKNVVAIAAGVAIGAGLGESARAALMTRGYAEMLRFALDRGARPETLAGLSGLGDLVLTCTSAQSRNFQYGHALGCGQPFDGEITVEGKATAAAVSALARSSGIDMPITDMVDALGCGRIGLADAILTLFSRPLRQE